MRVTESITFYYENKEMEWLNEQNIPLNSIFLEREIACDWIREWHHQDCEWERRNGGNLWMEREWEWERA